jgi:hypothetical protein
LIAIAFLALPIAIHPSESPIKRKESRDGDHG